MTDEIQVKPSEVKFLEKLKESDDSAVFKVIVFDRTCIMKVYRDIAPAEWHPPFREINPFICESAAYRRLKARGFCDRRLIPNFYGVITKLQPALWPSLDKFLNDDLPPNAVLIEYIPDLRQIDLSNFSKQRLAQLLQILHDMHKEKVLHGDAMPRNMMVSEKEDRVLWIDFDRAQTFSEDTILPRQESWFEEENELVEWFVENLPKDYEEGKLNRCYSYYYDCDLCFIFLCGAGGGIQDATVLAAVIDVAQSILRDAQESSKSNILNATSETHDAIAVARGKQTHPR